MYLPTIEYPTDDDLNNLTRVYLTTSSDAEPWNPPDVFNDRMEDEEWFADSQSIIEDGDLDNDEFFDSRDGFVYESNYLVDVNKVHGRMNDR